MAIDRGLGLSKPPSDRVFVALDMADVGEARRLVTKLEEAASCYKIGLELLFGGGLDFARELKAQGNTVFLDMKLLDIPNTVEKAVANVARFGLDFLTIHGVDAKTMDAAVRGRGASSLKLLAVTVLTSLDGDDLMQQGIAGMSPAELVLHRAKLAQACGFDGVIASGHEAAQIRNKVGPDFLIVTPGIRPAGGETADQARVMTPAQAIANGADYLVVGRPITEARDPKAAAEAIAAGMKSALFRT